LNFTERENADPASSVIEEGREAVEINNFTGKECQSFSKQFHNYENKT